MAFKLFSTLTFRWPVKVMEPDPKRPGKHVEHEFEAIYKILPPEQIEASVEKRKAILAKIQPETSLDEMKLIQTELEAHDFEALREVLDGWDKIVDEDDRAIPFTDTNLRQLYKIDRIHKAFEHSYQEAISQDRARLKN
ncbi:phage tail assembly chaperone [Neorhizobium petrolearium]|uniref:phage tail assembly chaperone n=1 Tax=Neorhizobium petrolearium TaxID=515361 RepID=UPI003F807191